ncbi:MAG: FHA domain-containing protein [Armatimonadota bacterium]
MYGITGRIVLYTLAGLAAGFLTWLFSDASGFVHLRDSVRQMTPADAQAQYLVGMAFGAFVAILLGVADFVNSGSWGQWPKVLGFGLGVGLVAGVLGLQIGMLFFGALYVEPALTPVDFLRNVLARAVGWAFIGAFAGTSDGWRKGSMRVGRNGFIGGAIGGLLGGCAFEIIPYLTPGIRASPISRLFGFLITGACIGLFVSLVQQFFKEAWIRIVMGRNEGRDIIIDKVESKIGRSELADVPLFGDPQIAKVHAMLYGQPGGQFMIRDVSNSPVGVVVNDTVVSGDHPIRDGDQIRIANRLLVFRERMTRNQPVPVPRDRPTAAPPSPVAVPPVGVGGSLPRSSVGSDFGPGEITNRTAAAAMMAPPRSVSPGAAKLTAVAGPHTGTTFPLVLGAPLVMGRDPANAIGLPGDTKASRAHARVSSDGSGVWVVEDNGSTNGTFVNGQRITRQDLAVGDTILIGTTALRFE